MSVVALINFNKPWIEYSWSSWCIRYGITCWSCILLHSRLDTSSQTPVWIALLSVALGSLALSVCSVSVILPSWPLAINDTEHTVLSARKSPYWNNIGTTSQHYSHLNSCSVIMFLDNWEDWESNDFDNRSTSFCSSVLYRSTRLLVLKILVLVVKSLCTSFNPTIRSISPSIGLWIQRSPFLNFRSYSPTHRQGHSRQEGAPVSIFSQKRGDRCTPSLDSFLISDSTFCTSLCAAVTCSSRNCMVVCSLPIFNSNSRLSSQRRTSISDKLRNKSVIYDQISVLITKINTWDLAEVNSTSLFLNWPSNWATLE